MHKKLKNSDILAIAKLIISKNSGGFPIKLEEYLAPGNLFVIANVGEIGFFYSKTRKIVY